MGLKRKPKKCKHCGKIFTEYKSDKREYCPGDKDRCKNQANYQKNLKENQHLIEHNKEIKRCEKILDFLIEGGFIEVKKEILKALHFNFSIMYNKKTNNGVVSFELSKYSLIFAKNDPENYLIQIL